MTLKQFRVFVAERQHATRTAEALDPAQSVVSAAIAAPKARQHARLFHRAGRGIEPGSSSRISPGSARPC
jgi:DNA-binding transcriptional LysR family regulator